MSPTFAMLLGVALSTTAETTSTGVAAGDTDRGVDIASFALPDTPANEVWFEEPRDVVQIVVDFAGAVPEKAGISYRRHYWPETKIEQRVQDEPIRLGWTPQDDLFNGEWQTASASLQRTGAHELEVTFTPLSQEFPEETGYDVTFRRSVAFRLDGVVQDAIRAIHVYTTSVPAHTRLRVELHDNAPAATKKVKLDAYNASITHVDPISGVQVGGNEATLSNATSHAFLADVDHMTPSHAYCGDDGLVSFLLDHDTFTISLASLDSEGPIWASDFGIFIARADDPTTFEEYRRRNANAQTLTERVLEHPEQASANAYNGQPRPHAVPYFVGCALARERFRVEPNGDVWVNPRDVQWVPGRDTKRCKMSGITHFRFGLEDWRLLARYTDPEPANVFNLSVARGGLVLDEKVFAAPLLTPMSTGAWKSDDPMLAMIRFRFRNDGTESVHVNLPLRIDQGDRGASDLLSMKPRGDVMLIYGPGGEAQESVLRCAIASAMHVVESSDGVHFQTNLEPGASCEAVVKVPHIALDTDQELAALVNLNFAKAYADNVNYWRKIAEPAATVHTPEPQLDALYASHLSHVQVTDFEMPDDGRLINTSVGTSVYGNFSNESCMIVHELDERGMHDQARRRLELWIKYQGTVPQPGNFTDYDGMYFGAGGFEQGSYNQHHGWVLWAICEHYFLTGDEAWFRGVTESVVKASDWVFRQRGNTMETLPHSRGWEHGFLPAGSLEDVQDFYYWLSTNTLTWRAVNRAADALEAIHHPEAVRVRGEADAYRRDLIRGFEIGRQQAPLVRLRNGRWIPNYPSRLYRRGRELGWIRETLEGSVYLLLGGLYDANSREGQWILDDYQDNRYPSPPYGYYIPDFDNTWFNRAGFSMQPNLLAGLMPYLDRDEPEMYIWMFYNAWCACYREEVNAMVEHPFPWLGYSNRVVFKTSDEANAVSWLRYMFIYSHDDTLYLGRAIPRAWFTRREPFDAAHVATPFGVVGVRYTPGLEDNAIRAEVSLDTWRDPGQILVRFRHPSKARIKSVTVNGNNNHVAFDPAKGDVDITGLRGNVTIEAYY